MWESLEAFEAWLYAPVPAWLFIGGIFLAVSSIGGTNPIKERLDEISEQLRDIERRLPPAAPSFFGDDD